jgi:prefoldin subunit 5
MTPAQKYVEEEHQAALRYMRDRLEELKRQLRELDAAYPVKPEQRTEGSE